MRAKEGSSLATGSLPSITIALYGHKTGSGPSLQGLLCSANLIFSAGTASRIVALKSVLPHPHIAE